MTIRIQLTQGKQAVIDAADFGIVAPHRWAAVRHKDRWYAHSHPHAGALVIMHRLILGAPEGLDVDHADGDGLNNTRKNLRLCSRQQNCGNQRSRGGLSRFKGVYLHRSTGKWRATIRNGSDRHSLGLYFSEEAAARAYDAAARQLFGVFASTNFPRPGERPAVAEGPVAS